MTFPEHSSTPHLVRAARDEEISEIIKRSIYTIVPISDCWKVTGDKPIGVRFVDVNKGDTSNPNYRSRLVAKEFCENGNPLGRPCIFCSVWALCAGVREYLLS